MQTNIEVLNYIIRMVVECTLSRITNKSETWFSIASLPSNLVLWWPSMGLTWHWEPYFNGILVALIAG